jgi:hypothetical protein
MIKFTTFASADKEGHPLIRILNGDLLEKNAGYKPDVEDFISTMEKKADHTYILVNAMTSGDFYGPNLNGDYFSDDQLTKYHKTFEKNAHFYRHHKNKNPEESAGKVIYASHNPDMHRVELVIALDNKKSQDILEALNAGELFPVSMGVRTPSDKCSICGNRSKNIHEYCDHLKFEMRKVLPDGRRVMAINDDRLNFFDISKVRIPADRVAGTIAKIASAEHVPDTDDNESVIPSAQIGEDFLKESGLKESALTKEVPATIEAFSADPHSLILDSQKKLPVELLDKIAEQHSLKDILSTFLGLRVMPRPEEFQRIVLVNMDRKPYADQVLERGAMIMDMEEQPQIPIDITLDGFNHELAANMLDYLPEIALTKPLIIRRVMVKRADIESSKQGLIGTMVQKIPGVGIPKGPRPSMYAPTKNPLLPMIGLGGLYAGFGTLLNKVVQSGHVSSEVFGHFGDYDKFLLQNPWLVPLFVGAVAMGTEGLGKVLFHKKEAGVGETAVKKFPDIAKKIVVAVPASYIYAGHIENKMQEGKPISKFEDLVRKHPFLAAAGTLGAHGWAWPHIKKDVGSKLASYLGSLDKVVYGLGPEKFEELYNDVVGITNP